MNDNDNQNNSGEGDNYDKYDSDGELNVDERQKSGPWNKVADDGTVDTTAAAALQERNSASSLYISPAMRNGPVSFHKIFTIKYNKLHGHFKFLYSFKRLPNCEKAFFPIFTMMNIFLCLDPLNLKRSRKRNLKVQVSRR